MIEAACHCTAIRLDIARAPKRVVDCNCTLCRRYGALWAYYEPGEVVFVAGDGETDRYVWAIRGACACSTPTTVTPAISGRARPTSSNPAASRR